MVGWCCMCRNDGKIGCDNLILILRSFSGFRHTNHGGPIDARTNQKVPKHAMICQSEPVFR